MRTRLRDDGAAPATLVSRLLEAAQAGDTADVQRLLAQGADINARGPYGNTPLMSAALTGHTDTLRLLLDKGANANAKGTTGRTALMEAAVEGYTEAVKILLEKGADVNAKDEGGWTALFWAAFSQRRDVARVLLEKGADANARNKYDDTPLIRAAYAGDTDTVKLLLEHKADVNAKDDTGRTALIEAARQGHVDAVRALLEKGADLKAKDREGETALSLAEKEKQAEVVALLKNPQAAPPGKLPEKTTTTIAEAARETTAAPRSTPATNLAPLVDKKSQEQAYFRMGMDLQMVETLWRQSGDQTSDRAQKIQQDLAKLGAPKDLQELASAAQSKLKTTPGDTDFTTAPTIRDLRTHLDAFSNGHPEGRFFYAAGGFTYRLNLLAGDLAKPGKVRASMEQRRREILALATSLADQCLVMVGCKELALIYFSDAATTLKKVPLTVNEGAALSQDASQIQTALNGEER